jgi:hypothetical protein
MNRTIFEIEIALLRSSLALWSIEFCRFRKIRTAPSESPDNLLFAEPDLSDPNGSH